MLENWNAFADERHDAQRELWKAFARSGTVSAPIRGHWCSCLRLPFQNRRHGWVTWAKHYADHKVEFEKRAQALTAIPLPPLPAPLPPQLAAKPPKAVGNVVTASPAQEVSLDGRS